MMTKRRSASPSERLLVGSSKTMTRAEDTSARATSTNCCAPTLRLPALASGRISGMIEQVERLANHPPMLAPIDQPVLHFFPGPASRWLRRRGAEPAPAPGRSSPHRGAGIARTAGRVRSSAQIHRARVRADGPAQDLHERALARAVLADQGATSPPRARVKRRRAPASLRTTC